MSNKLNELGTQLKYVAGDIVFVAARFYESPRFDTGKVVYQVLEIPILEVLICKQHPYVGIFIGYWFDVADYGYYRIFQPENVHASLEDLLFAMENNSTF